jgi:hypothetical protein
MTRFIQCDRCHATEPLGSRFIDPERPRDWARVRTNDDYDPFGIGPWHEVCPNCQTAAETKAHADQLFKVDRINERDEDEQQRAWREDTDGRYSGTPGPHISTYTYLPAVQIAHILVEMNEDAHNYSQHVHGAQAIAHIIADLRLDHAGVDAWFLNHGAEISEAISAELEDRGI